VTEAIAAPPRRGRGMSMSPMSPRVSPIQFLATLSLITRNPSVTITNE
jgi:hypothetical protein